MKILFIVVAALFSITCLTGCASQAFSPRGAIVGGLGGYHGYTVIGKASSESEAASLARSKGYDYYVYDSATGIVMGK